MKKLVCALWVSLLGSSPLMANADSGSQGGASQSFAVTCSTNSTSPFPGGYHVDKWCNSRLVGGMGTVLASADSNAQSFGDLGASGGLYCNLPKSNIQAFNGGYLANLSCNGIRISGIGTTATDTGNNALGFAELEAANGRLCYTDSANVRTGIGGYLADFTCSGRLITGVGSTVTTTGLNALGFALLEVETGNVCNSHTSNIRMVSGGYEVMFVCSRGAVIGVGSTLTAAGQNALTKAGGR